MSAMTIERKSKYLSLLLRHKPEEAGLTLDANGWVDIPVLLAGVKKAKGSDYLTLDDLKTIVATDSKGRYVMREHGHTTQIRAVHGHSIAVATGTRATPPAELFHGTATRFLDSIFEKGLIRGTRQHVHLTETVAEGGEVGKRHGHPVVLKVDTGKMHADGHTFLVSDSGIWLVDSVPPQYIKPDFA